MQFADAEHGPAAALDQAGQGVEHVELGGPVGDLFVDGDEHVADGAGVHGELDHDGQDVADVAVLDHQGAGPHAKAQGEHEEREHPDRQQEDRPAGVDLVDRQQHRDQEQRHGQVHEHGIDLGQREDHAWEVDFLDHVLVGDHAAGGLGEGLAEGGPGEHAGEGDEEGRQAGGGQLSHDAEDEGEDARAHEGLDDDPGGAEEGLLVAELDIAEGEGGEQVAEVPELLEVDGLPAFGRADGDGGLGGIYARLARLLIVLRVVCIKRDGVCGGHRSVAGEVSDTAVAVVWPLREEVRGSFCLSLYG